ncbi:MAG: hypothetical protein LWY06_00775 [Firmicutes bacterium]|nr:hypothetical protein [Bacillota bacterium]
MMMKRRNPSLRKGYTFTEIMIASFIALILFSVIYMCFILANRVTDYSEFSYMLSRETFVSLNTIMRDLKETSLTTVRVYDFSPTKESPIVTFEAASKIGTNSIEFSSYGTPLWQKYVIYTLVPDDAQSRRYNMKVASLVRYEVSGEEGLSPYPLALALKGAANMPDMPSHLKSRRVVLRDIVLDGQDLDYNGKIDRDYKGFDVSFIRRDQAGKDSFSKVNPAMSDKMTDNTKLLNVHITVLQVSGTTGKQNILGFSFRVHPRN